MVETASADNQLATGEAPRPSRLVPVILVGVVGLVLGLIALAFVLGRATAEGGDAPALEVGQRYVIQVPADPDPVEATYLGPCPGQGCVGGPSRSTILPYHLFKIGDTRAALYLVDWIEPAD